MNVANERYGPAVNELLAKLLAKLRKRYARCKVGYLVTTVDVH